MTGENPGGPVRAARLLVEVPPDGTGTNARGVDAGPIVARLHRGRLGDWVGTSGQGCPNPHPSVPEVSSLFNAVNSHHIHQITESVPSGTNMRKLWSPKRLGRRLAGLNPPKAEPSEVPKVEPPSEASEAEPLSEATAASPRSELHGLMLLAGALSTPPDDSGAEQYPVDIIAVHGLNGDAYRTWTHDNGVLWLRDLLPGLLPGCRVFTYGYPSQVAFSTSFSRVQDYARQLLSSVRDVHEEAKEASQASLLRPTPKPCVYASKR